MSVSHPSPTSCTYCDDEITTFYSPGYCSEECYHREQGERLLRNIETDHTTCANCGTKCKVVEPPTQSQLVKIQGYFSTKALEDGGGYQYKTWRADKDELPTVCGKCGNCTLGRPFPESQAIFLREYTTGLLDALARKRRQGVHEKAIDRDEFFQYLETPDDIPLALGRAIE